MRVFARNAVFHVEPSLFMEIDMANFTIAIPKAGTNLVVNFAKLPPHIQAHIIEYGLKQKFNDVHSAEKDGKVALGLVNNLYERLLAGELSKTRGASNPIDRELDSLLVQVAKAKTGGKVADLKAMEREEILTLLAKVLSKPAERIEAHFTTIAKANVAKRAAEQAALLSDIEID